MTPTYPHQWRCDCDDIHYVCITDLWEDENPRGYFSVQVVSGKEPWRNRFKNAWLALRNKQVCWAEVVLTPGTADEMVAALRPFTEPETPS